MMRYSFSIYETLALTQIFGNKIENNSPLKHFYEELPLTASVKKNQIGVIYLLAAVL